MTEHEWLTRDDPVKMLDYLKGGKLDGLPSDRKLRLFACAMWRRIPEVLEKFNAVALPDIAERMADQPMSREEIVAALKGTGSDARFYRDAEGCGSGSYIQYVAQASKHLIATLVSGPRSLVEKRAQSSLLRELIGNPFRQLGCMVCRWDAIAYHPDYEKCTDCDFGLWLRWSDFTVPRMAQAIYDELAFERLPVLADALEEAGCDNVEIIEHLRGRERCGPCEVEVGSQRMQVSGTFIQLDGDWGFPKNPKQTPAYLPQCKHCHGSGWRPMRGPHVRGCWVLDLLLGKE